MQKPRLTQRTAMTNAEKQAAWRARRQAKLEALEKENAKLKADLSRWQRANMYINAEFTRALLREAHQSVKNLFPVINLRKDAWVHNCGRDHWEFHGPQNFYWHGRAWNAYEARYKGWMAWLRSQYPDELE